MENGAEKRGSSESNEADVWLGRRDCMKLAGAAATAVSGAGLLPGTASAATTVHGMTFDRTLNVVDDLGVDPTGNDPVDDAVRRAATDGTLLVFPEGEYLWTGSNSFRNRGLIGFQGQGDVRFTFPQGFHDYFFVARTRKVLFENFTIDIQQENTVTGMKVLCPDGFHIQDVEYVGRGTRSDSPIPGALFPYVTSEGATGVVKNLVAKQGSAWAHYKGGGGRGGIHVGTGHHGTLRVIDCHLEEFGNNGIYGSDTPGNVQVEGGIYRNNNVAGVRLGGDGSYVDGALIEVDPSQYTGPRTDEGGSFNMRGIILAQKPEKYGFKGAGAEVRNCDIRIAENPSGSSAGIDIWHAAQTLQVTNTRIQMDENSPAIRRSGQQDSSVRPSSSDPRWVRCDNVSVTGSADGGSAVVASDANGSRVTNSCLYQSGNNRDGVSFSSSDNTEASDSTINVTGTSVSGVDTTQNITESGTCPVPDSSPDSGSGGGSDPAPEPEPAPEQAPYTDHDPARIEAEDYDTGGEGVAYHDTTSGNAGGAYRDDDVDIQSTSDDGSGYNVGWIDDGEWLEYTVNIPEGTYDLNARIAGLSAAQLAVSIDGEQVATLDVPETGGWQNWETVSGGSVSISGGEHVVRVTANGRRFNLNWFGFDSGTDSGSGGGSSRAYTDHDPARIEAEDYDTGGEGVAYHDASSGNTGGAYRDDDVDIQPTSDDGGGYNVGWVRDGEWLEYTVNIPEGTYDLNARVSGISAAQLAVSVDGEQVATLDTPDTNGWQNWETVSDGPVSVSGGEHVVRVTMVGRGFNLNWIGFEPR